MYQNPNQEEENVLEKYGRNITESVKKGKLVGMKKLEALLEFYHEKLRIIPF